MIGGAGAGGGAGGAGAPGVPGAVQPGAAPTILKRVDPVFARPGETVIWTIIVSNPNNIAINAPVNVVDNVPIQLAIQSATSSAGTVTVNGQQINFTIPGLAANQTVTITITSTMRSKPDPVIDAANVPYVCITDVQFLDNIACLNDPNGQVCSQARVACLPDVLPTTGEAGVQQPSNTLWKYLLLVVAAIAIPVVFGLRKRYARVAA